MNLVLLYSTCEIIWYLSFSAYLISLSRCPQDPSLLLQMERFPSFHDWVVFHHIYTTSSLSIHPLCTLTWFSWLGYCKICCREYEGAGVSLGWWFCFLQPEAELLGHMIITFVIFWGTSILFSIVAVPIYIPSNGAQDSCQHLSSLVFFFFWPHP